MLYVLGMLHIGNTTVEYDGRCWNLSIPNPDRVIKGNKVEGRGSKTTYYGTVQQLILALYEKEVIEEFEGGRNLMDAVVAAHNSLSTQIEGLAELLESKGHKARTIKPKGKMPKAKPSRVEVIEPVVAAAPAGRVRKVKPPKTKA